MNDVNVEELYQKFNPLLLKTAKGKMFVEVLGEEDAYQEACLAFMEVIRRAERENPDLLYQPAFPGYLQSCICNWLINAVHHEQLCRWVEFKEEYFSPCPSFEHSVWEQEYLGELEQFLIDPQTMILKANLTVLESKIIYLIFKLKQREYIVAGQLSVTQQYVSLVKREALRKLRIYLENHKF